MIAYDENSNEKREELFTKIRLLIERHYIKQVAKAFETDQTLNIDFTEFDKLDHNIGDSLLNKPDYILEITESAMGAIQPDCEIKPKFFNSQTFLSIRNIRSKNIGKFITVEGFVRKASDVKPEIVEREFMCKECNSRIRVPSKNMAQRVRCVCGSRNVSEAEHEKIDVRWLTLEESFETSEGEKPTQLNCFLSEELVSETNRRMSEVGNRIRISGILREIPKEKASLRLDFYLEVLHVLSIDAGWERLEISKEDEEKIKELSQREDIYQILTDSFAPSLYGLNEIKEAVIYQFFGGMNKVLNDGNHIRGDIHVLLVGDPSCIVENERVVMSDGSMMKIGKMGKNHLDKIDYQVHVGKGKVRGQTTEFHKFEKQPIMEIITETGKSIQGTYNQMVLIKENRERKWKRLDELKIGERVCTIPKIDCIKTALVETKWQDSPTKHKSFKIKIPEYVDEKLASIFGYVIGDGWIDNDGRSMGFVVNKKKRDISKILIGNFKDCFDVPVKSKKQDNNKISCFVIDRSHLCEILSILKEKRVPDLIWQSRDSVVASFLSWLYEADGCAFCNGRGRTAVSFKSSRLELLRDVQMLLLRFGIQSRIAWDGRKTEQEYKGKIIRGNGSGNLTIRRSESIIKFTENIGFIGKNKKKRLNKAYEYAKKPKEHIHTITKKSEKIKKINILEPQDVFDITVPEHERFVANGIIVHNSGKSQLLKIASDVAPRSRYVSGKGSSSAGLTATVTKDELMGGWVLEAGALVLTNKGLLCVDEFEKMDIQDQTIFHEAMEQGTVSIAKASIVATLPAKTSILAGANPKLSRFDSMVSISRQITIPDTLLTRFDLKYILKDIPNTDKDRKLVEHILKARKNNSEETKPKLSPEFIRKYIAYAKEHSKPEMTDEAESKLTEFYLKMRKKSGGKDSVAITPRQFEALLRLAEASAKIQLSQTVREKDADNAVKIMMESLQQLGYDPDTKMFDIDRLDGSTTASERGRIKVLVELIQDMSSVEKEIRIRDLKERAKEFGVKDVDILIQKMLNEGMIFNPTPATIMVVA